MNTGSDIETERMILRPASNERDTGAFLEMLRADGDFRQFCGRPFSEKNLQNFNHYFERLDSCLFGIFEKERPEIFIGYVGVHHEMGWDTEFYIARKLRNKGYCTEALTKVCGELMHTGLMLDGRKICLDKLYAKTLRDNAASIRVLEKCGFRENREGEVLIAEIFCSMDDTDEVCINPVTEFVLENRELRTELDTKADVL